jgi:methionyl-tRNA formyltransferase
MKRTEMPSIDILFMGTAEFAVPSLRKLAASGHRLISVVTGLDEPRGRGQKILPTPVKAAAVELGLPVIQPESLKDPTFAETVRQFRPDLIVVVAFRILPPQVFEIPRLGSVNLHSSLLPKYRGAAPINWAIINGEKETGVTTFFIQQKVDTGNVIVQRSTPIEENDTAGTLHDRLSLLGADVLLETVDRIASGTVQPQRQDDRLASPAPKIFKDDCRIDWTRSADRIYNFVRGLSPYPCAWTTLDGVTYKIYAVRKTNERNASAPGTVVRATSDAILIAVGDGRVIAVTDLQPASRKRMSTAEFLRGHDIGHMKRFG